MDAGGAISARPHNFSFEEGKPMMREKFFPTSLLVTLGMVTCALGLHAQKTTASLQVIVSDSSQARIPDARVEIVNDGTGAIQTRVTDASGTSSFPELAVGNYTLSVERSGFARYVQSGITLAVGQDSSVNISLQVGPSTSEVKVTADLTLVDTRTPTSNEVIGQQQVADLPLNGREPQQLIQLAPGTVDLGRNDCFICAQGGVYESASGQYSGPGPEAAVQVNGTQRTQVNYLLDGVSNNDDWINSSEPFPNPDAIQEFALQSGNFSAEYGQAAGGVVNIVSKSGTNKFHGSAFEFLRNGGFNANNWFKGPFFGSEPKTLHRNQYGGAIGGPIVRDKLFFFGSFQGSPTSETSGGSSVTFVPTAAERTGDFSALLPTTQLVDPETGEPVLDNKIPNGRLSTVAQNFLKYVPLPNTPSSGPNALTFIGPVLRTTDNQALAKIDYSIGKSHFGGHYFFTRYVEPSVQDKTNVVASPSGGDDVKIQTVAVNHTYVRSERLLFNTTFGLNMQNGGSTSSAPFSWADLGSQIASASTPEIAMYITGGFNVSTNHQGQFNRGDMTIREAVTTIRGRHEFHFGGQALREFNSLSNTYLQSGQLVFSGQLSGYGLADFEYGQIGSFTQDGGQYEKGAATEWSLFAQDNWRISDALTISAGLRWDPWSPYHDRQGRVVCFSPGSESARYPNAPAGLVYGGDHGCPKGGYNSYALVFGPRLGFAYRLDRNGNTSIRGGAGVYSNPTETADYSRMVGSAPFAPTFSFSDVNIANPYTSAGIANPFPAQFGNHLPGSTATFVLPTTLPTVFSADFRPGMVESYNLIIEHQLGKASVARIAYIGNRAVKLSEGVPRDINAPVYVPGSSSEANTQARRPNQNFSSVEQIEPNANSNYNGLQASLEKRLAPSLTLITNFTLSRSLDDLPGYAQTWTNPASRREDYGPTYGDSNKNFKLSEVWTVPTPNIANGFASRLVSGWELSSFTTWQDGTTETVFSGYDNSFSSQYEDHGDYLGGPVQITKKRNHAEQAAQWFNTAAFAPNAIGTFGTASKGQVRDPAYFDTDLALQKNTVIREGMNLQLRAETFNTWNNVNFKWVDYYVSAGPGAFGQVTGALDPREMQLSARITF
jgi:hypothetical protein